MDRGFLRSLSIFTAAVVAVGLVALLPYVLLGGSSSTFAGLAGVVVGVPVVISIVLLAALRRRRRTRRPDRR